MLLVMGLSPLHAVLKAIIASLLVQISSSFGRVSTAQRRNPSVDRLPAAACLRSRIAFTPITLLFANGQAQQTGDTTVREEKKSSARSLAVEALLLPPHLPIADRLSTLPSFSKLSLRDRAFCRLLVATVERRFGQIDALLHARLDRKPPAFVNAVLRVGVAQLVFLDTPPHAAVQATVSLVRHRRHRGLVNAVLRKISTSSSDSAELGTVTSNAAPWLVQALTKDWGATKTEQIITCAMEESPRTITVDPGRVVETGCVATLDEAIPYVASQFAAAEVLPQGSIRVRNQPGPIHEWPLFDDGVWWCQDPSATLPALAVQSALRSNGASASTPPSVIDMCAAPGGKTAQLLSFGYTVTAVDVSAPRSKRLRENMERISSSSSRAWKTVVADGTTWTDSEPADAVLLDVPCSATGTASKRPDVLRKDIATMEELQPLQHKLAQHAVDHLVRPSGILVYATCSILQCESEDVVRKLLTTNRLEEIPFQPGDIPGFDAAITEEGWIRVLPGSVPDMGACDGFFVARLRKMEEE